MFRCVLTLCQPGGPCVQRGRERAVTENELYLEGLHVYDFYPCGLQMKQNTSDRESLEIMSKQEVNNLAEGRRASHTRWILYEVYYNVFILANTTFDEFLTCV